MSAAEVPLDRVREALALGESAITAVIVQADAEPRVNCDRFDETVRGLYWLEKGASGLVRVGQIGIRYCLDRGLKAEAKTIAYNVAANTWPGWGDEGVVIAKEDQRAGLEAARLNLQLGEELGKPADKIAGSHWLIGVLAWANGDLIEAAQSLKEAEAFAERGGDPAQAPMVRGFAALVAIARGEDDGESLLAAAKAALSALATDDAAAYLGQIETARAVLIP